MDIAKNRVVTLFCRLHVVGEPFDAAGTTMYTYLHGAYDGILPGLERALDGKSVGESVVLELPPECAFGDPQAELVVREQRDHLPGDAQAGRAYVSDDRPQYENRPVEFRVVGIDGEGVILDGNHPLAGKTLRVECTVGDVRAATPDEVQAGRPQCDDSEVG